MIHSCSSSKTAKINVMDKDTIWYCYSDTVPARVLKMYPDLKFPDSYLELIFENNQVKQGLFWGDTDEFDDAREGYECGFFILSVSRIRQKGDSLFFILDARKEKFFTSPIPLNITSSQEAIKKGCQLWDIGISDSVVSYAARISKDSLFVRNLTFETYPPERIFVRKEYTNSIKKE